MTEESKIWTPSSGLLVKKFLDTSGVVYKELKLSSKPPIVTEEEQIAFLVANGKLVKRPLIVTDHFVLIGFKPEEWEKLRQLATSLYESLPVQKFILFLQPQTRE